MYVHAPFPTAGPLVPSSKGSVVLAATARTLEQWWAEAEARVGAPVRTKILFGEAVAELLRHTLESGCELLIVGPMVVAVTPPSSWVPSQSASSANLLALCSSLVSVRFRQASRTQTGSRSTAE